VYHPSHLNSLSPYLSSYHHMLSTMTHPRCVPTRSSHPGPRRCDSECIRLITTRLPPHRLRNVPRLSLLAYHSCTYTSPEKPRGYNPPPPRHHNFCPFGKAFWVRYTILAIFQPHVVLYATLCPRTRGIILSASLLHPVLATKLRSAFRPILLFSCSLSYS
jgi:hypothetical protein